MFRRRTEIDLYAMRQVISELDRNLEKGSTNPTLCLEREILLDLACC
jgi:hypothetical protein